MKEGSCIVINKKSSKMKSLRLSVLLFICIKLVDLGNIDWYGYRRSQMDIVTAIPGGLSCHQIKDLEYNAELSLCRCKDDNYFHVFNSTSFGCFQGRIVCGNEYGVCKDLGHIETRKVNSNNDHFVIFKSHTVNSFDATTLSCPNSTRRLSFSSWEGFRWKVFANNVEGTFSTNREKREIKVPSFTKSASSLLRIVMWCRDNVKSKKSYIVRRIAEFSYSSTSPVPPTSAQFTSKNKPISDTSPPRLPLSEGTTSPAVWNAEYCRDNSRKTTVEFIVLLAFAALLFAGVIIFAVLWRRTVKSFQDFKLKVQTQATYEIPPDDGATVTYNESNIQQEGPIPPELPMRRSTLDFQDQGNYSPINAEGVSPSEYTAINN